MFSEPEDFEKFGKLSAMSRLQKKLKQDRLEALHDDKRSTARRNHLMHLHLIYGGSGPFQQSMRNKDTAGWPTLRSLGSRAVCVCGTAQIEQCTCVRACVPECPSDSLRACVGATRRCATPCVSEASGMSRSKATSSP